MTDSEHRNMVPKFIRSSIAENKLYWLVGSYIVASSVLMAATGIDLCIPCLWKSVFGFSCPGCGLTSAFIALLKLNPTEAFYSNPMIFLLLPFGVVIVTKSYKRFKVAQTTP